MKKITIVALLLITLLPGSIFASSPLVSSNYDYPAIYSYLNSVCPEVTNTIPNRIEDIVSLDLTAIYFVVCPNGTTVKYAQLIKASTITNYTLVPNGSDSFILTSDQSMSIYQLRSTSAPGTTSNFTVKFIRRLDEYFLLTPSPTPTVTPFPTSAPINNSGDTFNPTKLLITPFSIGMIIAGTFGFIGLTLKYGFSIFDNVRR